MTTRKKSYYYRPTGWKRRRRHHRKSSRTDRCSWIRRSKKKGATTARSITGGMDHERKRIRTSPAFSENISDTHIDFKNSTELSIEASNAICANLQSPQTTVTSIDISYSDIDNTGLMVIVNALRVNQTVTSLDVRGCRNINMCISISLMRLFSNYSYEHNPPNTTITHLYYSFTPNNYYYMSQLINSSLTHLECEDTSGRRHNCASYIELANALCNNSTLEYLKIPSLVNPAHEQTIVKGIAGYTIGEEIEKTDNEPTLKGLDGINLNNPEYLQILGIAHKYPGGVFPPLLTGETETETQTNARILEETRTEWYDVNVRPYVKGFL